MSAEGTSKWFAMYSLSALAVLFVWPVYVVTNFPRLLMTNGLFALGVGMLALDQGLKWAAVHYLKPLGHSIEIIDGYFKLTYVQNQGAAFGLFRGQIQAFILIALFTVVVILLYLSMVDEDEKLVAVALVLILAGAVGNLIDRACLGYVIDYLHVHYQNQWHWPVFNWADTIIDVGVGLIVLDVARDWFRGDPDGELESRDDASLEGDEPAARASA